MTAFGGLTPSSESQQTQQTMTYRMLDFKYGNGYEARLGDGANYQIDTWQITFDNLNATDSATLKAWLLANPPFTTWNGDGVILPSSNTYWITEDGWQMQPMPGNVNAFTFNISQAF
jgi:phage-related protein